MRPLCPPDRARSCSGRNKLQRLAVGADVWPEVGRLLGEIRAVIDRVGRDDDVEAAIEVTTRIEVELTALVAEARGLSSGAILERLYALRLEIDRGALLH